MNVTKLYEWPDIVVTIVCWHTMTLVVFIQEDEYVPSVYRNLFFVKRPPTNYTAVHCICAVMNQDESLVNAISLPYSLHIICDIMGKHKRKEKKTKKKRNKGKNLKRNNNCTEK